MSNFTPGQTGFSRVFLIEGRARADHEPSYESCLMAGGVSQGFGDVEKIECPDPNRYGEFIEVGQIQGTIERATMTLSGRFAADLESTLLKLAKRRCSVDVQVHFGQCTDPSDFNEFTKALIIEDARLTNYDTEDLGTLSSDGSAVVGESTDISAKEIYEALQLSFAERAGDVVTNEVIDGVGCDRISCGDCDDESVGCQKWYFLTLSAGGSPGTPADVVFSIDGGANWYGHDIDTLGAAEDPDALACLGTYLVVVSEDSGSLHYATKDDILPTNDEDWTEDATGFVAAGGPRDIWSTGTYAFIVGDNGYVYGTSDPTAGVTVLDAGVATSNDLTAVHALNDDFAVAVGNSGTIIKTETGDTWTAVTPTDVLFTQNWEAVWVKSEREWWVAGATVGGVGQVWYTLDGGSTWTQANIGGTYTDFYDIAFASDSVAYLTGDVSGPAGRILRTFSGGESWVVLPEGIGNLPSNDRINAIAACEDDVNIVVGGGLADNGTDGIIVVGED
jgi:hypothetical protein